MNNEDENENEDEDEKIPCRLTFNITFTHVQKTLKNNEINEFILFNHIFNHQRRVIQYLSIIQQTFNKQTSKSTNHYHMTNILNCAHEQSQSKTTTKE